MYIRTDLLEKKPTGTKAETASQVIGAFLTMRGLPPWQAEDLLLLLSEEGFTVERSNNR